MKKLSKKDLKVLDKIKKKAVKGGKNKMGCPPPWEDEPEEEGTQS